MVISLENERQDLHKIELGQSDPNSAGYVKTNSVHISPLSPWMSDNFWQFCVIPWRSIPSP